MSNLEELEWSDIIPAINDSINRIDLFVSQFKDRDLEDIEKGELQDFIAHLEDAQSDLEKFREEHYYEGGKL